MSFCTVWRVEDPTSSAVYKPRKGIQAGDPYVKLHLYPNRYYLRRNLKEQLDLNFEWPNSEATGLISEFTEYSLAEREAKRRLERGHRNVVISEILVPERCTFARLAVDAAEEVGWHWPQEAEGWIECEMLFAHLIDTDWIEARYVSWLDRHGQLHILSELTDI